MHMWVYILAETESLDSPEIGVCIGCKSSDVWCEPNSPALLEGYRILNT